MIVDEKVSTQPKNEDLACQIARWKAMAREMERINDPSYLPVVSMRELFETVYPNKSPIIDGFLYTCTYLIAGAPKIGKSFLVAQIAYHVSTGQSLWGYPVHRYRIISCSGGRSSKIATAYVSNVWCRGQRESLFLPLCQISW